MAEMRYRIGMMTAEGDDVLEMVRNVFRQLHIQADATQREAEQRIEREVVAQLQILIEETRQLSTEIRRLRSQ